MKKMVSMILSFTILSCVLCNFDCKVFAINANVRVASDLTTGEIFEMGMYPQTKVEDEELIGKLNNLQITMYSYDYVRYVTNGNNYVECDMNYGDVVYRGGKYRKVYFSQYRTWKAPNYTRDVSKECQSENGYIKDNIYWFKWEPVKWRVLNVESDGLYVMSENILDSQEFGNSNWEQASLREWLNQQFYEIVLTSNEKNKICLSTHHNKGNSSDGTVDHGIVTDNIWLLSWYDMQNKNNGFSTSIYSSDSKRQSEGTDYAKCQGLMVSTDSAGFGKSPYRLITGGWDRSGGGNCFVKPDGSIAGILGGYSSPYRAEQRGSYYGVRPVLKLNLDAEISNSDPIVEDNISFDDKEINGNVGETKGVMVILDSAKYDFNDVNITSSNPDIVKINRIGIGDGPYFPEGNEKVATVYLEFNDIGNSVLTATTPDGITATLNVTVERKPIDSKTSGLVYLSDDAAPIYSTFDSDWFLADSSIYNHDIAGFCSLIDLAGYKTEPLFKQSLQSFGFDVDDNYLDLDTGRDEVNYFIASKDIDQNGKTYHLVFVGCIGSNKLQWNSDFDPDGRDSETTYSNSADLEKGNKHRGFNDAKNFILYGNQKDAQGLLKYLSDKNYNERDTKILITGHSRGAATANLLSAELIDDGKSHVLPQNLFTYTFATPNNTTNPKRNYGKYCRIFNIVNPADFVTKAMPSAWGWGRYGTTYSLPTKSNDKNYNSQKNNMLKYYRILNPSTSGNSEYHDYNGESTVNNIVHELTSIVHGVDEYYNKELIFRTKKLLPLIIEKKSTFWYFQNGLCPMVNDSGKEDEGQAVMLDALSGGVLFSDLTLFFVFNQKISPKFEDAHKMETYCSFMLGLKESEVTTPRKGYKGTVNCPVDIEVFDKGTGEIVGRIKNNIVDEDISSKANSIVMTVDGDNKEYWLPSNGDYEVRLCGNADGVMDYTLSEIDSDLGETARTNYFNLDVEKNKTYTSIINAETQENPKLSDFALTDNSGNEVTNTETIIQDELVEYSVETSVSGSGSVSDSLTVISGDYVTVIATPDNSEFLGWYCDNTLVSKELEYRFRPVENVSLIAKFSERKFDIGDTNLDGKITISDVTEIQKHLAELIHFSDEQLVSADTNGDGKIDINDATHLQKYLAEFEGIVLGKQPT